MPPFKRPPLLLFLHWTIYWNANSDAFARGFPTEGGYLDTSKSTDNVSGSFGAMSFLIEKLSAAKLFRNETPISTVENPPQTAAWVFKSKFYQKRPWDVAESPPSRSQTPHPGLILRWGLLLPFPFPKLGDSKKIVSSKKFGRLGNELYVVV